MCVGCVVGHTEAGNFAVERLVHIHNDVLSVGNIRAVLIRCHYFEGHPQVLWSCGVVVGR